MSLPFRSLKAIVSVIGAGFLYFFLLGGPSTATAACQCGVDSRGNCIPCPQIKCPPGPPGSCKVQLPTGPGFNCDPPRGSYVRSCTNIKSVCDKNQTMTLSASCSPRQGPAHPTTLGNAEQCVGDISNMDGELHCSKGASPPGGSYKESCRDMWVQGGVLYAQCRHSNGQWTPT